MGRTGWAVVVLVAAAVTGVLAWDGLVPSEPAGEWVSVGEVSARAGADVPAGVVRDELGVVASGAGLAPGAGGPEAGELVGCVADWTGNGPADAGQWAALEAGLTAKGWRVTARRGEPVPGTRLEEGPWTLEITNGGLLDTLSLYAHRSGARCEEAFRREAARRAATERG
ncbi:hypothetical protein OOK31_24555 [Streptomyces sp. NBC_00249]|uniref:hypothetical protein n=1 Tax=Streptomyces sp. NBC_00249 TaxID=2975690 RepID=UPI00224FC057|nr:hypothetical protein [Streptomyces sp. NBC_00249]MCX5197029.1 hypothetical protein [Streptomyces sp. NBC_00249]